MEEILCDRPWAGAGQGILPEYGIDRLTNQEVLADTKDRAGFGVVMNDDFVVIEDQNSLCKSVQGRGENRIGLPERELPLNAVDG